MPRVEERDEHELPSRWGRMSDADFVRLSRIVEGTIGIRMLPGHKTMIEARLARRVRVLGLSSHSEYCNYLLRHADPGSEELRHFLDLTTTNKTSFFRECQHFSLLQATLVPTLMTNLRRVGRNRFQLWSAGCSTGQEAYSLAMAMSESLAKTVDASVWDYVIFASDVSTRVLAEARRAVYDEEECTTIPHELLRTHFLRSKDRHKRTLRVAPELRRRAVFSVVNFMSQSYPVPWGIDVCFLRNVLIYFDRSIQEQIVKKVCEHINPGGYLFVSHSETLRGFTLPLSCVGPSVYAKVPEDA